MQKTGLLGHFHTCPSSYIAQYLTLPPFYMYLWDVVCGSYPCSSMGGFSPRLLSDVLI